jgi:hypothetical protein
VRITEPDLRAQFDRATVNWPWIRTAEQQFSVPPLLLYALGSRETNLRNVNGDSGHGRGIWQRDDRSFDIPDDYLRTPMKQATDAAGLLMNHFARFRAEQPGSNALRYAVAAYNAGYGGVTKALKAGRSADYPTTDADYSTDVLERWSHFVKWGWPLI